MVSESTSPALTTSGARRWVNTLTCLKIVPLFVSAVVVVAAFILGNYELVEIQPSGLPEYTLPYAQYFFYILMVATALLIFGVTLNLVSTGLGDAIAKLRGIVAGSAGFAVGATLSGFSSLFLWIEQSDYATRCGTGGCATELSSNYRLGIGLLSIAIVTGLVLAGFGLWLIVRSRSGSRHLMVMSSEEFRTPPPSSKT
jgi:hypothetical protein